MGAVSLRPLVSVRQFVGVVAGSGLWRATTRSGRRRTFRSGAGAAGLASVSDSAVGAASAGSRSGPCDFFHPWWGGYRGRFGVVNVTNIHITNINRYGGIASAAWRQPILEHRQYSQQSRLPRDVDGKCGSLRRGQGASHGGHAPANRAERA